MRRDIVEQQSSERGLLQRGERENWTREGFQPITRKIRKRMGTSSSIKYRYAIWRLFLVLRLFWCLKSATFCTFWEH